MACTHVEGLTYEPPTRELFALQVAERAQMKEALCTSMASQLIGVHEELAAARNDLGA